MSDLGYQLIDFGDSRKLESFAGRIIDRPSPAAEGKRRSLGHEWSLASSRFDSDTRAWDHRTSWPVDLMVDCSGFRMPIQPTPFGHVGLFPEQAVNWSWLQSVGQNAISSTDSNQSLNALNLFGYTGASTMALATAGFHVAHVDAAKPNVQSAREAAKSNGLCDAPIRYLVDDAAKFSAREVRRGNQYHTIVLDPPAYGHSPQGKTWRLERDLWPLLDDCLKLINPNSFRLLVTGHSAQVDSNQVANYLLERIEQNLSIPAEGLRIDKGRSQLTDRSGRKLDAGFYVRCSRQTSSTAR